ECPDAACAQFGISDRPAFFSHPVGTEAAVRSDKIIVLLALANVLRWALVPFRVMVPVCRNRGCLYRGGRQSYQTDQGWNDHTHFSLCLGVLGGQRGSVWASLLTKGEIARWLRA